MNRLLDPDPAVRASAFEACVLQALGRSEPDIPWDLWAGAYRSLSLALTEDRTAGPSAALPIPGAEAIAGLIHGSRTFLVASALLDTYPVKGPFTELGAGWGAFGLAAALRGAAVHLVDAVPAVADRAQALFLAAGLEEPRCTTADVRTVPAEGNVALPYLLNELGSEKSAHALLAPWLANLGPDERLFVLEPGMPATAHALQRFRESVAMATTIYGPCTQVRNCPRLAGTDWCHFNWRLPAGPVATRLGQLSGLHPHEAHVSWLVLGAPSGTSAPPRWRVLERRRRGRGKWSLQTCAEEGEQTWVVLERSPGAEEAYEALVPGTLLEIDVEQASAKGDGLRVEPEHLHPVDAGSVRPGGPVKR